MKTPVIGSRSLTNLDISQYIPADTTMIILGGAKGIDSLAETYAYRNFIPVRIFLPDYEHYGKKSAAYPEPGNCQSL